MKETAAVLQKIYYDYTYIFKIRWISSEFRAVFKIQHTFDLLITDLESMTAETDMDENTQSQALGHLRYLKDNAFSIFEFPIG